MTDRSAEKPAGRGEQIYFEVNGSHSGWIERKDFSRLHFVETAEWYLTVRCKNDRCYGLIAFKKTASPEDNPHLRLLAAGLLSICCPHCETLVRFDLEDIRRQQVVLVQ